MQHLEVSCAVRPT